MACPTCGHTMQGLGNGYFWCERCGTLKDVWKGSKLGVPRLVERVGALRNYLADPGRTAEEEQQAWERFGVNEAIDPPKES